MAQQVQDQGEGFGANLDRLAQMAQLPAELVELPGAEAEDTTALLHWLTASRFRAFYSI